MALVQEYALYLIGGALVLGFVIAWILRGLKKSPAEQRAAVDRDIALLELQQTKDELDSLFAAQRKRREEEKAGGAGASDPALKAQIVRLEEQLTAARAESEALRKSAPAPMAATETAVPPADAAPAKARSAEETALRNALISRNEYLETRIHGVELRLHEMAKAQKSAGSVTDETPKAKWLAAYRSQRMEALQARLVAVGAGQTEDIHQPAEVDESADAAKARSVEQKAVDEELARLRWRNRYLESRLAYLAEAVDPSDDPDIKRTEKAAEKPDERPPATQASGENKAAKPDTAKPAPPPASPQAAKPPAAASTAAQRLSPEKLAERGPRFTSPAAAGAKGVSEAAPPAKLAEARSAGVETVEAVRPPALEVADGKADDLTRISGLSSSIELRLNEIGIWHFGQIAAWEREHEAWIDKQFGLDGMARREGWVSQARQLSG